MMNDANERLRDRVRTKFHITVFDNTETDSGEAAVLLRDIQRNTELLDEQKKCAQWHSTCFDVAFAEYAMMIDQYQAYQRMVIDAIDTAYSGRRKIDARAGC